MGDLESGVSVPLLPEIQPEAVHRKRSSGGTNGVQERPNQGRPRLLVVLISTLVVALGPITFGFSLGFTSPTQGSITRDLGLTVAQFSWYGSLVNIGAMLGAVASGSIAGAFGRKSALAIASVPHILGWIMNSLAQDCYYLYVARVLVGFGVGVISFTVPIYIAEIAPGDLRGSLGTVNQLSVTLGILFSYLGGLFLSWRSLALTGVIPCSIMLLGLSFIPESPRWLARKGLRNNYGLAPENEERLYSTLQTLRGSDYDITLEREEIVASAQADKAQPPVRLSDIWVYRQQLFIGIGLQVLQQLGGINAIMFYSSKIFSSAGFASSNLASLSLSVLQVIMTGVAAVYMDRAGRRCLLMISATGMGICCFIVGLSFYLQANANMSNALISSFVGKMSLTGLLIYIACFSLGMGPIPWIVMAEIFPQRISGKAGSVATATNWMSCFLVTMTFNSMLKWSSTGSFAIFGAECLLTVVFVKFRVPETRNRSLEEVQALFGTPSQASDPVQV